MNAVTSKPDSSLTGMWVNFFTAAGIPSDVAATYALTFTENRIQSDMLLDLNKEYLRDMGIARMGDVIAILRHAKQVHENAARDRVLSSAAANIKVPVAAVTGRLTVMQNKPSSPASRMLEHYTRNSSSQETSPVGSPQHKRKHTNTRSEPAVDVKKSRLIRFAASQQTVSATAPKEGISSKSTVFSRLGNSEPINTDLPNATAKPVFSRLGTKTTQTNKPDQIIPIQQDALKYEGILKTKAIKKVVTVTTSKNNVRKIACTMRADETPINIRDKLALPKPKSVKFSNHIEYKEIEASKERLVQPKPLVPKLTTVFNKPERRLSMPKGSSVGVKSRLGEKSNNLTITRNIFNRLGV